MNVRQYLLFLSALTKITVAARQWGPIGWVVVAKMRGGSDHVDGVSEDEYSGDESEPEVSLDWDSEDTLSDVEETRAFDPSVNEDGEELEKADSESEELLQDGAEDSAQSEAEDDNAVQPEVEENSEAEEEIVTEPEVEEAIRYDRNIANDEVIEQSAAETKVTEDSNVSSKDSVQDDPTLVEDDSSANVDPLDLADAYDEDFEAEPPVAPPTPSKSTTVDAVTRRKLIKDLKYKRDEVKFMKPEIAFLVAEKQLPRPVEGIPPHWLVAQPKSGIVRKVLALTLTAVAIVVATQKLDVPEFDLSEIWRRPRGVSSSSSSSISDPFDLFELTEKMEGDSSTDEEIKPVNEHVNAVGDVHPHSIKPGQHSVQDDLDATWLDKLITSIERKVQAFFRIKL
ncbi:hypothetical protein FisN_21Lh230 [Fistulifera solaris]|uniref:Uncharacterized protein n=1 Tax=Fistulifera solaris TaxID=1519565 RepID=A0A1Z5J942_FISSO|nr:hypothetical protein FisN_21Lh230 [Fistulifera solaris]|eukprot:GAX10523.1 hypothetical protein FisN_21Lh230 [Fistulifera solaris]